MQKQNEQSEASWGMRINAGRWGNPTDWPAWANPRQQEKWAEHGLVLWDQQAQQIIRLSAAAALQLLNHLRTTDDWRENGLTIGEPTTKLFPNQPDREPEPSFLNSISLLPDQLEEILVRLERRESDLEALRGDEAE